MAGTLQQPSHDALRGCVSAPPSGVVLALEFGGTRVRAGYVTASGEVLARGATDTQASRGAAHVLAQADALIASMPQSAGGAQVHGVGISAAGIIDRALACVLAAQDTMPGWAGTDLRRHFETRFSPALPVWADNDANCALMGELWRGRHATEPQGLTVMLTLGTGLGGAIACGTHVISGATQRAGHFGSLRVWHPRQQAVVSLESVVSGTGLMTLYHLISTPQAPRAGGGLDVAQWAGDTGHPAHASAHAAMQEWVQLFAAFLQDLQMSLDPARVILGGGMLSSRELWWDALSRQLRSQGVSLHLAPATLGNDAGLLGAAHLAWHGLEG